MRGFRPAMVGALLFLAAPSIAAAPLRFWNLTSTTITRLELASPGTDQWGADQLAGDSDHEVDPDERLTLTGIQPGRYDVRLSDRSGRVCVVRNVVVVADKPYAFSLSDDDLEDCHH
jgi:hypothetical protein